MFHSLAEPVEIGGATGAVESFCQKLVRTNQTATSLDPLLYRFLNFTPWTTWANNVCPLSKRQFCSAVFVSLKTIASMPARETQPRVLVVRSRSGSSHEPRRTEWRDDKSDL